MSDGTARGLFDEEASRWEARYDDSFYLDRLNVLERWLVGARSGRVLDVGCGSFPAGPIYAAAGFDAVGVDISPNMVEEARRLGREALLFDGARLPFSGESFERVSMFNVIEFVDAPQAMFEEIHRVMRPGGRLLFTIVNVGALLRRIVAWRRARRGAGLFGAEWKNDYTPASARRLLAAAGFDEIHVFRHSMPVMYDQLFAKLPRPALALLRNRLFSDSIYIEAVKPDANSGA